jgi:hypothetical protein
MTIGNGSLTAAYREHLSIAAAGDERLEERWRALELGGPQRVQMAETSNL